MAEQPEKIGSYAVEEVIGEGARGTVYKAKRPGGGSPVAVKVMRQAFCEHREAVERFHSELEILAGIRHPNVVRLLDKGEKDGSLFLVMEYVAGTTLEKVLRRRRLSLREAFLMFKKVCRGLQAAHSEKLVHKDLSPRSILVSDDLSTVKIADFGLSRVEAMTAEMGTLATSQVSLGSLHYMAPELAVAVDSADQRSDIYSLGVLFYEMLTGRVPVGRFSLPSASNAELPSEIDPLVLRCLETRPGDRYSSVSQVLSQLDRLDDRLRLGLVSELRDISRSTSKIFLKPRRSRATKVGLTALALVIAGAATVYLLQRRSEPTTAANATRAASDEGVGDEVAETVEGEAGAYRRFDFSSGDEEDGGEPMALRLDDVSPPGDEPVDIEPTASSPAAASDPVSPPPSEPAQPAAREDLEVAQAKVEAGLYEPALRDLEEVIDTAGDATAAAALLLKGEVHRRMGDNAEAKAAWIELDSRFGDSAVAPEASYRLATLDNQLRGRSEPREVWKAYNQTIAKHPGTVWAARALMDRAELEQNEKWRIDDDVLGTKVPMAMISYRQMTEAFPRDAAAEKAFFELAEMYEDLRRFELAAATWERLAGFFPGNRHDAWWRAAQLYDSRRASDPGKAIEAYEKVPESSRHHGDAQKRLARLRR